MQKHTPLKQRQVSDRDSIEFIDKHPNPQPLTKILSDDKMAIMSVEDISTKLDNMSPGTKQPEVLIEADKSTFTWSTKPFMPEHVAEILKLVEIGADISQEEQEEIEDTVAKFTDIFALSISEVKHIPGAEHHLDIPDGTVFNKNICQHPLSPPQAAYFSKALDIMLGAGICAPIVAKDVKCISPITLSAKTHMSAGMTIEELHQHINDECDSIIITPPFIAPDNTKGQTLVPQKMTESSPQKWHVCTNYMELNKVT